MSTDSLDRFVREHFQRLECNKYVRNQYSEDRRCECNRDRRWHEDRGVALDPAGDPAAAWDCETCCARAPTNAHGKIKFRDFGRVSLDNCPKFIRIQATGASMDALWALLTDKDKWGLPYPDYVLSLNGGAGNFMGFSRDFAAKLKQAVLSVTSGQQKVWIFTHGCNIGAAAQIGMVMEKASFVGSDISNISLIGLNSWGNIHNSHMLEDDENYSKGGRPIPGERIRRYDYAKGDDDEVADDPADESGSAEQRKSRRQATVYHLDKNHTHFILVDDGSTGLGGREIRLRTELEKFVVTKMREVNAATRRRICSIPPVLQICVEGGKYTLLMAEKAADEGTPVIAVRGSGRSADKLAWASEVRAAAASAAAAMNAESTEARVRQRIKEMAAEYVNTSGPQERRALERALFRFAYPSEEALPADLLAVFDPTADCDLSRVILDVVFRHRDFKADLNTQMMLAMAWDRADIAEARILSGLSKQRLKELNLSRMMARALMAQQVGFVQLFMTFGVSASAVLTRDRLERLYLKFATEGSQQGERLLARLLQCKESLDLCSCCHHHDRQSLAQHHNCRYEEDAWAHWGVKQRDILPLVDRCLSSLTRDELQGIYTVKNLADNPSVDPTKVLFPLRYRGSGQRKYNVQDLFIWSLLCHNMELAEAFWRHGKNHIGTALVGSMLLRRMAQDAVDNDEMELKSVFETDSAHFEELAVGVLARCYQSNPEITKALLIRELPMWNRQTALSIAEGNQCLDFMHHSAVQDLLTMVWMGGMATSTSTWRILVSIFLPVLAPVLIFKTHRRFNLVHLHRWRRQERARLSQSAASLELPTSKQPEPVAQHAMVHSLLDEVQSVDPKAPSARELLDTVMIDEVADSLELNLKTRQQLRMEALYRQKRGFLSMSFVTCLKLFYTAPLVKCILNCLATLLFLGVFSYIVLMELGKRCQSESGPALHWTEWFLFAWIVQFMIEEGRQFSHFRSIRAKLAGMSHFDRFDLLICCLFVACGGFRIAAPAQCEWAQCVYALTLSLFFLRFMQFYYVHHSLGPKVLMIIEMFGDIVFFIAILVIFLLSFGVASMSLRDENKKLPDVLAKNILATPYWQMYGELNLEGFVEEIQSSTVRYAMAVILLAIYMLGTNVLLLNLLIAMFGNTFDRMQSSSFKYWCHIRHDFIKEYYYRPCLPPPLIFLPHLFRFAQLCYKAIVRCRRKDDTEGVSSDDFVMRLQLTYQQRLQAFEKKATDAYMQERDRKMKRKAQKKQRDDEDSD
ncbi:hypothetical protein BOX15_Mlig011222g3 [Macrostomum lignano]|uniref:LSDAT_euk domain-containing protein n=1 Tax=Macrostomum lignano TaxID=282301 RepID=A0A267DTP6_9PLAT|nr:hypothetical protein BOX15_Mlig011222g3 [Macrostomum lignano]